MHSSLTLWKGVIFTGFLKQLFVINSYRFLVYFVLLLLHVQSIYYIYGKNKQ